MTLDFSPRYLVRVDLYQKIKVMLIKNIDYDYDYTITSKILVSLVI